ncbi:la-related protein 1C-like [Tasmannia lanceolata]|uniref:la-related protein 1C-like n=1 Tax=Tasmannia lanceolata TaxID=3420 RepID=UPI00406402C2
MAMATDSPSNNLSSPWWSPSIPNLDPPPFQDSDLSPANLPGNTETLTENSDGKEKKPAWKKPSNVSSIGSIMDSDSWPALSESARVSPKSSSDSLKTLSEGSVPASQGPVIASSPRKSINNNNIIINNNNGNPNSTPNHTYPTRQKPMKHGGGPVHGNFAPALLAEMPHNSSDNTGVVVAPTSSPKDSPHKSNNSGTGSKGLFVSQGYVGNDHPRNPYKRGNGGPHPRGDRPYHNNFGYRRDHERTNSEWNSYRNFSNRDLHLQPHRVVSRPFIRPPPPPSVPFISPQPVRPFGNPMGFPEMSSPVYYVSAPPPESFGGVQFFTQVAPPTMFFPAPDPQLHTKLVKQIEYYFSSENLCKDIFLRQNMDEQGWVPISLIAGFKKVKLLTNNIQFILDTIRTSTFVEVQGDKIRKCNDWKNWLLPPPYRSATTSGSPSPATSKYDMLVTRIQNVGIDDGPSNQKSMRGPVDAHIEGGVLSRSSSGVSLSHSVMPAELSNGEVIGKVSVPTGNDGSMSARSLGKSDSG